MNEDQYILENYGTLPNKELAHDVNQKFGTEFDSETIRAKYRRILQARGATMTAKKKLPLREQVQGDSKVKTLEAKNKELKEKYDEALKALGMVQRERDAVKLIDEISTFTITPHAPSGKSESVAVVLASDWHIEEKVDRNAVNGLNEYNLKIAEARVTEFFRSVLRLTEILQKDTRIDTLVLALLGDFISGNIHEDIAENTELGLSHATIFAEKLIASGIEMLLANSKLKLIIPCHSGNHGRVTREQRYATENANSIEYYMYHTLAGHFANEKRVQFVLSPSYHSYLDVFGYTIRFHHGHALNYGGGVGGIFIPAYKAVSNWNDGRRADLDCFGHFHQLRDGGTFICNGSLIGYNSYAIGIKAKFEKPKQVMFLIEKTRGRTFTVQISV